MHIKYTTQGTLIYLAMGTYLLAFIIGLFAMTVRRNSDEASNETGPWINPFAILAQLVFAAAFALAFASFIYRWNDTGHVPLKDLFDVFVTLAMLVWPISMLCRWALRVDGRTLDMLVGAVMCIPAGFVRDAETSPLRPALQSDLFVPHVAVYMLGTVIMVKAAIQAVGVLIYGDTEPGGNLVRREAAAHRMTCMGFPLLTTGLFLGAIWGKYAWGDFWQWDPKEQWSLATWLAFVVYFHVRYMFGKKYPKLNAACIIAGTILIFLTLLWANLDKAFKGIHSYA